jgi:hypothetical protein
MIRVDIVKEAIDLSEADRFVEDVSDFLQQEAQDERELLSAAGLDQQQQEVERIRTFHSTRRELQSKTGAPVVLSEQEVRTLCIRYRLRCLPSRFYAGAIDPLLGRKLKKFLSDLGSATPSEDAQSHLYVMAPMKAFRLTTVKHQEDPVLFYRDNSGFYVMIHKWGNDFTIARRALGWLLESALRWRFLMFLSTLAVAAPIMWWGIKHESIAACVPTAVFFFFITIWRLANVMSFDTSVDATFSNTAWNRSDKGDTYLFWI